MGQVRSTMKGSPFLIISVLFFSVAVGQCDNTALQNCATTYVNGALTLASFADRTTGECTLLRDFFQCLFNACPGVQQEIRDALQAYQTVFNQCGFILPGAAGLAGTISASWREILMCSALTARGKTA